MMGTFFQDIRYALRTLTRKPGFTIIAVLTLALGIGASTAIFSVLESVILRPLPFANADRLIFAYGKFSLSETAGVSGPDFRDYRASNKTFDQLAAMQYFSGTSNISGGDKPELVESRAVSWNFFDALGIHPIVGRSFEPADEQNKLPQVVILGHGLWKRAFGGDPNVIGKQLTVEGASQTVVGVLPEDVPLISKAELWLPMPMLNSGMGVRKSHPLTALGLMKTNVTLDQARADLDTVAAGLAIQYSDADKGWSLHAIPLREKIVGSVKTPLLILMAAVAFLLLIACANVANLLLVRASTRRKEIAIRMALGAGAWRIVRQLLTESILLSAAGGALGFFAAVWGVAGLRLLAPASLPRIAELQINGTVLAFALGVSIVTGLLFGLAPALQIVKNTSAESLKSDGKSTAPLGAHRLGSALVIGEIALSLALLLGGALLLKSFWKLAHVDPGFRADHVLTARLDLPDATYETSTEKAAFLHKFEERVSALPGVQGVGAISELPLDGQGGDNAFYIEGRVYAPNQFDDADFRQVSPGYVSAMKIPLLAGRWFDERDTAQSPPAIVVNQAFATRYFSGKDAVGKRLQLSGDPFKTREIVGVAGTTSHWKLSEDPRPEMYVPAAQSRISGLSAVVRTENDPRQLANALQEVVSGIDKDEAVSDVRLMDDVVAASISEPRFSAQLLALFASLALLLAAVGLYGLIAYTVTQRTREIGIRMALGAEPRDVLKLVIGQGLKLALAGAAIGIAGALALSRLMQSLLFQVSPTDPFTFISVTGLLTIVALAASYLPARRAMRVDPMIALRYE